jgi:hypothetical protein
MTVPTLVESEHGVGEEEQTVAPFLSLVRDRESITGAPRPRAGLGQETVGKAGKAGKAVAHTHQGRKSGSTDTDKCTGHRNLRTVGQPLSKRRLQESGARCSSPPHYRQPNQPCCSEEYGSH